MYTNVTIMRNNLIRYAFFLFIQFQIFLFSLCFAETVFSSERIENLASIEISNRQIAEIRGDVRKSIYIIKSRRDPGLLPQLKFYKYRATKNDSFWIILTRTSLNIDTLMTINSLSSPGQVEAGKTIYIPNMRGILYRVKSGESIDDIARKFNVGRSYIARVNTGDESLQEYIFVPCAEVTSLERSLFLGTGFSNPLRYARKTSGFGHRKDPFDNKLEFHKGIDLACPVGTKIHAARAGKVVFSGYNGGYGKLIVLRHSHDYYTYYGHLNSTLRHIGDNVEAGEIIGISGNTGRTTGPHLHFEVRKDGTPVNPGVLIR